MTTVLFVKRFGVLVAAVLALALAGGKGAPAQQLEANCSLFTGKAPLWLDFADGSVPFWNLFARPGVTALASNFIYPPKLREAGAQTAYFDLYLNRRVGTTSAPADPATIVAKANTFYEYAAKAMDCSNPVIAENELFGSWLAVPWSKTNAQYRANVLLFLQTLRQRGAQPWLLVNAKPYTDSIAGDWWRQVADVAGIVREVYFPAPLIYRQGPIRGSRTLRQAFRNGVLDFTKIGIPVSKLGIFLGFQTSKGSGGREGLEAKAWFRTVKWQALAARYVAKEMNFSSIWSWGWAEWTTTPGERDPAKPRAACVYLWTRSPGLCNGLRAAGKGFVPSRTEGQLILPPGLRCQLGAAAVRWSQINPILKLTGDPELAFSNAFGRAVAQRSAHVGYGEILAAERTIISARFGGSRAAYLAAITDARANLSTARGIIGDELRRARIESTFRVRGPSARQIADFHETYADLQARLVQAKSGAPWLGGRRSGYTVESAAPPRLMTVLSGRWSAVWSPLGTVQVRPLGPPLPLGTLPLGNAREAIRAALIAQAREDRYPTWLASAQQAAFPEAVCWRDQMPEKGEVDLTNYLPFLSLTS
ncbi:MAG: hypothetical protein QOE13_607 [Gaiellaceae bacterium]|nr:hypothetical protein [Gaiellaceae bacterium]